MEVDKHYEDDEIDLIDLFAVLLRRKWLIIGITLLSAVGVVVFSIISLLLPPEESYLPNQYTPQAHMVINDSESSSGLSSLLSSNSLGGVASLMGVSVPTAKSNSAFAIYLVGSNPLLDAVVEEFNFIERFKIEKSPRSESRRKLRELLKANFDDKSGVFSLSYTDIDPEFAQKVVNFTVHLLEQRFEELGIDKYSLRRQNLETNIENTYSEILNLTNESQMLDSATSFGRYAVDGGNLVLEAKRIERELRAQETIYTELKTQYELLKVEMASESPVFQVLEYAEVPDKKSGPGRGMLCIIVTFAAFFGSVFIAFVLNAIGNIKKDPKAMAKLKGIKDEI